MTDALYFFNSPSQHLQWKSKNIFIQEEYGEEESYDDTCDDESNEEEDY